jgi:hypothetical protein
MADSPIVDPAVPFGNPRAYRLGTVNQDSQPEFLIFTETGCGLRVVFQQPRHGERL